MVPRDRGTIVQVGSAMAYRGIPLQAPYCGAKHAIKGVFESLRCELRHKGSKVHVTMVQLPGVNTPQFEHCRDKFRRCRSPSRRSISPRSPPTPIHWAAHHRRREVYVGIPTVYTIWGNKVAPWLVERYLARTAVGHSSDGSAGSVRTGRQPVRARARRPGRARPVRRKAHPRSVQLWATKHRGALGAAAAAAGTALVAGVVAGRA